MSDDTFTVREAHLELLDEAWFREAPHESAPAPQMDAKRPFGNSGWKYDVEEIVSEDIDEGEAHQLLADLSTVIDIVFSTRTVEPGIYRKVGGRGETSWEPVEE